MNSVAVTILTEARELLNKPNGWIQKDYARDANGKHVAFFSNEATCFCSKGAVGYALNKYSAEDRAELGSSVFDYLREAINSDKAISITDWNDRSYQTQQNVVAIFDKAIAIAKEMK